MTATATVVVDRRKGVFLVSNAALRFSPFRKTATAQSSQTKSSFSQLLPTNRRPPGAGNSRASGASGGNGGGPRKPGLWVLDKEKNEPRRIEVEVGPTDGIRTEVRSEAITEGMEVLVGMTEASRG
jgi:HlyD family secretion protein